MSQVSLGRPEFVPGTPPGHPDRQIPLCDFSLSVFFSPQLCAHLHSFTLFCGDSFCDPNPHIQGKNMNKNMAPKLPNLPCFEAFGVIFCTDVCSYFCLVCGGWGSLAYF